MFTNGTTSNNGPNQVLPAKSYFTTNIEESVKLRLPTSGTALETHSPVSVPGLLQRTSTQYPDNVALSYKDETNQWQKITYREYHELVRTCAKAFLHLGLQRHNGVCILGFNSVEWFVSDLAAIYAGGVATGIYTTNSPEACLYCCNRSRANIIVVQDEKQLDKILAVRDKMPNLKAIVQYEGEPVAPDVLSWKQLIAIGNKQPEDALNSVLKTIGVNECCTLVFTSGTVGKPKAVMLSHDNLIFDALAIYERVNIVKGKERIISFLPLSHVAAQVTDIYISMVAAGTIYFADKNALKGTLLNTLKEVRPSLFLGVPRVWEKIYEKMMQIGAQSGSLKKMIATWAKSQGTKYNTNKMNGNETATWGYTIAQFLVFKRIKQALGLDHCHGMYSAAAPLSADIKKYFMSIDIPIMEVFGMSEASGGHTISVDSAFNMDTVGKTIPGLKTKVYQPEENGTGEICMYGRNVFMGYLDEPEKTHDALDDEGWLHSGDIGRVDSSGFVYITGRLKELLITAGGENVPPVPIEQNVQNELPHLGYAVLVGDRRKFLALLVTLKAEMDQETGKALDALTGNVKGWLNELGCPAETITEVIKAGPDRRLLNAIQAGIDKANEKATSNAQKIQKFAILPTDFSIPTGELGPTLKIRRNIVYKMYGDIIESLYV